MSSHRESLGLLFALLVVLFGAALYFVELDATPVQCGNETMYVLPPLTMLESGDWLVPRYLHGPFLDKPPLTFWIVAAFYELFGVSLLSARLPGALAAVATILAVALWVRRRSGGWAALLAACALAFSFKFVAFSRQFAADAFLTLAVTLAILALDLAARREDVSDLTAGALSGGALALAFGFKGLIGIVLPVGAVAAGLLLDRTRPVRAGRRAALAALLFLAAVLPWHVAMTQRLGLEFWRWFYWSNQFVRATTEVFTGHPRGPFFYLAVLAWGAFPWILFAPASVWNRKRPSTPAAWLLFGLLFLSALAMKREVYVMPLLPAVAVLAGETMAEAPRRLRGLRLSWLAAAAVCAAGIVVWWRMAPALGGLVGQPSAWSLGIGLALMLAATLWAGVSGKPSGPFAAGAACGAAFLAVLDIETRIARYDPLPDFGQNVRRLCPDGCKAFRVGIPCTSMEYYSRQEWIDLIAPQQLVGRVPPAGGFVIVRSRWEPLIEKRGFRTEVLERRPWLEQNWAAASLSRDETPFESLSLLRVLPAEPPAHASGAAGGP
jgi:4-amino-4-deoxy-L-arabinose transferase-like glycosyltransferase